MSKSVANQDESRRDQALISEQILCPRSLFAVRSLNDCLLSRFHFTDTLTPNDEFSGAPVADGT